jgi:hypothetical protein
MGSFTAARADSRSRLALRAAMLNDGAPRHEDLAP